MAYPSLFQRADGAQFAQIGSVPQAGTTWPVVAMIFRFTEAPKALSHLALGRAQGKIALQLR